MTNSPDMLVAGLKMLASLGVVLALLLGLLWLLRALGRQRLGGAGGRLIEVIENHPLGVKKSISLIRVPGKVLVVAIAGDQIRLLETVDAELIPSAGPAPGTGPFAPMLARRLKELGRGFTGKDAS